MPQSEPERPLVQAQDRIDGIRAALLDRSVYIPAKTDEMLVQLLSVVEIVVHELESVADAIEAARTTPT